MAHTAASDSADVAVVDHPPLERPHEPEGLAGLDRVRSLGREAIRLSGWHILAPSAALLVLGLTTMLFGAGQTWSAVGQALLTGAIVTGGFGWTEALNSALRSERERQIDLGTGGALRNADLAQLTLTGMYLRHADLNGARLSGVLARNADLHGSKLRDARLTGATLEGSDLTNADLTGAGCYEADFTRADLRWATLVGAGLGKAVLADAQLAGADLRFADLRAADLSDATIDDDTRLEGAWISDRTRLPDGWDPVHLRMETKSHREGSPRPCQCTTETDIDIRDGTTAAPEQAPGQVSDPGTARRTVD